MPTEKPRITISVTPATKAVLDRLQKVANKPASTFIAEVINEAAPLFDAMALAIEQSNEKKSEAFETLAGVLAQSQVGAAQLQLNIHNARGDAARKTAKKATKKTAKGGRRASAR